MSREAPMGDARRLGLVIGLATGPAGGYAQSWSGIGDGRWHVTVLMTLVGALLGALTLPVFIDRDRAPSGLDAAPDARTLSLPFLALFGFAVAVVGGTFAAFPVGSSVGSVGGAVGAVAAGLAWRVRPLVARPAARGVLAAALAITAGWGAVAVWIH